MSGTDCVESTQPAIGFQFVPPLKVCHTCRVSAGNVLPEYPPKTATTWFASTGSTARRADCPEIAPGIWPPVKVGVPASPVARRTTPSLRPTYSTSELLGDIAIE